MTDAQLKKAMMELWKDAFHDSDAYVSLVFDTYFTPDLVEYELVGDELAASLLAVPYRFGNAENSVNALYLCGLATRPKFRSRGIMTRLLARINEKASSLGYTFTFLIPADAGLRKYYHDREYVNAFYRVVDNYTSLHDFDRDYDSVLAEQKDKVAELKRRYYASLEGVTVVGKECPEDIYVKLESLISGREHGQLDLRIIHSPVDIRALVNENLISGGAIYCVKNKNGDITAAAFADRSDKSEMHIIRLYYADLCSKYKVLGEVKKDNPDAAISVFLPSVEMDRKALWQRTYGSFSADGPKPGVISMTERVYSLAAHARVYGMARILNLHEILKFQANQRKELKYSILVKGDDSSIVEQIRVSNGRVDVKQLPSDSLDNWQSVSVMSRRAVAEILFRRHDTDVLITEALGMPSVGAAASLLLD